MKKLFPDEKGSKKGIREFLDKKGFYIVLLLCIAVVAATAVYVTMQNVTSNKLDDLQNVIPEGTNYAANTGDGQNASAQSATAIPAAGGDAASQAANTAANTAPNTDASKTTAPQRDASDKTTAPNTSAPAKTTAPAKAATPKTSSTKTTTPTKQQEFIMPVFGEISFEYARDKVVYSKTLEEWRTHNGADIAADRGAPVKAVADGVVTDIKNDPRFGVVVVIDHKNGLKTVYANLASDDMVTPNQKVTQGEVIGCIGNTATIEAAEQSHLHFEVLKNNDYADPMAYLPENTIGTN